ncbi:hypothetical protein [Emticicia sp. BO119]|uniref:hypothetical protein n=1 Tax=Emticicia sp. BO119 TaxID=2757768 RepID=UPI0015F11C93|nr:hypothetical protein [Emticicia sp. BO119]MBA4852039.1 hypothetical protein [Emticicia sp. BO119]
MKAIAEHNGKKVEILLTPDQEAEVRRQTFDYKTITTVEDAFSFLDINYTEWLEKHKELPSDVLAYMQLTHITKAINGGEWMTYESTNEYKYYPWFYAKGSPSGFSYCGYVSVNDYSRVGSRLTFKSREIAIYAGKQFIEIYNQYIN